MALLPEAFYCRNTVLVARALLGQRLVRVLDGQRISGLINETEAYRGRDDHASHAYRWTPRSAIMFGPPGRAYVYLIYGRNFCLNAVTEPEGEPGAVLIRSLIPLEGRDVMLARRPAPGGRGLADGPGKLCQALGIDLALNETVLLLPGPLYVESEPEVDSAQVQITPRVGVGGDEETRQRPWRFFWRPPAIYPV